MRELIDYFTNVSSPVDWIEATVAVIFSAVASVCACLMYHVFYGAKNIGAGVNRTFLVGGPSITMLFLGIQTSVPLSLGLLGALSFVRFRTPVKDPAEIGFLLLLVAASIGAATQNYTAVYILYGVVLVVLSIEWLIKNRFSLGGRGHLMIAVDEAAFQALRPRLDEFLGEHLSGLRLETVSVLDDRVSLRYQYRRRGSPDWPTFVAQLTGLDETARIEVFAG